jgi:ASC-1-like (ASCH) protein
MLQVHELKIRPEYFDSVSRGKKSFEIRRGDRQYKLGDILVLREYVEQSQRYTGREVRVAVTYILIESCYVRSGYVVMGIRKVDEKS